jgi:hypothetical protein
LLGCAPILKSILGDENYVKAGCAIDEDLLELFDLWGELEAKSRFDLGVVFPRSSRQSPTHSNGNDSTQVIHMKSGLKSLSRSILGVDLPKEKVDSQSDWSLVPLSENQIVYAARDAWAGAAIANKLAEYDPEVFGLDALINLFQQTETPISELSERRRKRRKAKADLELLLKPYSRRGRLKKNRLPKRVQRKVQRLRKVINARVIDHHFAFETHHFQHANYSR